MAIQRKRFINVSDIIDQEVSTNPTGRKSRPTKDQAERLRNNYKTFLENNLLEVCSTDSTGDYKKLTGLSFRREEILLALKSNEQNMGVHFAFGLEESDTNNNLNGMTVLVYGIDSNTNLIEVQGKIFDYCVPTVKRHPDGLLEDLKLPATIEQI